MYTPTQVSLVGSVSELRVAGGAPRGGTTSNLNGVNGHAKTACCQFFHPSGLVNYG